MFREGSQQPDWQEYEHVDTVAYCVKDLICGITGHQGSLEIGVEFTRLILISAKLFSALVKHPLDLWPKDLSSSLKSPGFIAVRDYPARITRSPVHFLISNIGLRGGEGFFPCNGIFETPKGTASAAPIAGRFCLEELAAAAFPRAAGRGGKGVERDVTLHHVGRSGCISEL